MGEWFGGILWATVVYNYLWFFILYTPLIPWEKEFHYLEIIEAGRNLFLHLQDLEIISEPIQPDTLQKKGTNY